MSKISKIEPKIFDELKTALVSFGDKYFVGEELNRSKLTDDLRNYDEALLSKLFEVDFIMQHFIKKVAGQKLFQIEQLEEAVLYNDYWDTSYTKYENRVGLASKGKFLQDSQDVVLDFPFKDCVLTASMTKENNEEGYDDAFLNEVIEKDEIDRLFDKKVFVNVKRFGDNQGAQNNTAVDNGIVSFDKEKDNLIIKGNNLLALHTLSNHYAGKVKSIFIDPPYNTGNDGFGYNDSFKHSSWLTFMKNRLEIARELLSNQGSITIAIDYNELGYLLTLADSIFGKENLQNIITVRRASASGAKVINPGVVTISDYLVVYSKNKSQWKPNKVFAAKDRDKRYNQFIKNVSSHYESWEFMPLLEAFAESQGIKKSQLKKELGEAFDRKLDEFAYENADSVFRWVSLDEGQISQEARALKHLSKDNPDKMYYMERTGYNDYYMKNGKVMLFMRERLIDVDGKLAFGTAITDIWDDVLPNDLHNEGGVSFKKGKKPEKLVRRILELTSNENDLVMDFFAGSGTTGAVAHKINRQWILVEQMDYIEDVLKTRLLNTTNGDRTAGISKDVAWQGGGSFVYAELFPKNMGYLQDVIHAKDLDELKSVYDRMLAGTDTTEPADISFRADLSKIDWLQGFDENKRLLVKLLDKNGLYYNFSEIDDKNVRDLISDEDYTFNKNFYEGGD